MLSISFFSRLSILLFASVLLLSGCNNDSNSKAELNFPTT